MEKVKCMGKRKGRGKMYRIYLVEDDVIIARSIKKHLENWEYEVQCTKDFQQLQKNLRSLHRSLC